MALILYDLCSFIYYECLNGFEFDDFFGFENISDYHRSRSYPNIPKRKISKNVLSDEEDIVFVQPVKNNSTSSSDNEDMFDDLIKIEID